MVYKISMIPRHTDVELARAALKRSRVVAILGADRAGADSTPASGYVVSDGRDQGRSCLCPAIMARSRARARRIRERT